MNPSPRPVYRWYTLYFDTGIKSFKKLLMSEANQPIVLAMDLVDLCLLTPGFNFSYEHNEGSWRPVEPPSHVVLDDAIPNYFSKRRAEHLYRLYQVMPSLFSKEIEFRVMECGSTSIAVNDLEAFWG